jgi:hypothetical protein
MGPREMKHKFSFLIEGEVTAEDSTTIPIVTTEIYNRLKSESIKIKNVEIKTLGETDEIE